MLPRARQRSRVICGLSFALAAARLAFAAPGKPPVAAERKTYRSRGIRVEVLSNCSTFYGAPNGRAEQLPIFFYTMPPIEMSDTAVRARRSSRPSHGSLGGCLRGLAARDDLAHAHVLTGGKRGTGPVCAKHPPGRSGKMNLSPFSRKTLSTGHRYVSRRAGAVSASVLGCPRENVAEHAPGALAAPLAVKRGALQFGCATPRWASMHLLRVGPSRCTAMLFRVCWTAHSRLGRRTPLRRGWFSSATKENRA